MKPDIKTGGFGLPPQLDGCDRTLAYTVLGCIFINLLLVVLLLWAVLT